MMTSLLIAGLAACTFGTTGFLIACCLAARRYEVAAARAENLATLLTEREELVNQMALTIRNIAFLVTDDRRDTKDIITMIARTEQMLSKTQRLKSGANDSASPSVYPFVAASRG
jgi:hypothetical protein